MSSKRLMAGLLAGVMTVAGCGLHTGEDAPIVSAPVHSGAGFNCLSRIPEHVDKYINDELEDAQINDFTGCLQKAFRTFAEMTRGREESIYAPGEIRRFLHEYFIKDRRISDGLMDQLMIVKQLFVGGGRQHITRAELYLAVEVLEDLRKESLRLKPHMKYLNPRLARKQDPRTLGHNLRLANEAVGAAIQTFTARLRDDRPAYPFQDLEALFTEIRGFVGWETHFVDSIPVKAWVSLMRIFRELTLAPPESEREVIRPKDWTPLLQNASRWYLGFLEYEVGIKSQPLFYGIGLQNLVQLAQDVFALIEASISRQPGMTITFAQLSRLTQAFSDVHWLPNGIRVVSVQQALEATFTRVFGDPDREPSKRHSEGVNLMSFQRLKEQFYRWAYVQIQLDTRYRGDLVAKDPRADVPKLQDPPLIPADLRRKIRGLQGTEWEEFIKLSGSGSFSQEYIRPLFPDDGQRIMIVPRDQLEHHHTHHEFHNLSMMNVLRSVVTMIFKGYRNTPGDIDWNSGIDGKDLKEFFDAVREIGIDLGLVDERNYNAGDRAFIEGNLFTYSSDGLAAYDADAASQKPDWRRSDRPRPSDNQIVKAVNDKLLASQLRFNEAMELFAFLYSGGMMAYDMYKDLKARCPLGPVDRLKLQKISRRCVEQALPDTFARFLTNMPGVLAFLSESGPETRANYVRTLLDTARSPKYSVEEWVEMSEFSTLAVVMHYSEAVMTRFDLNGDLRLDNAEINQGAIPVFLGYIKKFSKDSGMGELDDGQAQAAFYYILANKTIPVSWSERYIYVPWEWAWPSTLSLDRYELSTVFRVIIGKIMEAGKKKEVIIETSPVPFTEPIL